MCNHRIIVIILRFCHSALPLYVKSLYPRIWKSQSLLGLFAIEFRRSFAGRVMKKLNIPYAIDYCCLLIQHVIKSLVSGIEIWKICYFPNDVFRLEKKVWNQPFPKYSSLKSQSKFVIKLYMVYNVPTCQAHGIYYFLNKRTILDIAYFRFSHENWLSHICLKFERSQFKSLSHNYGASEEYELTSATSLWLNIAHAHITNTVEFKALSLAIPFLWMFWNSYNSL